MATEAAVLDSMRGIIDPDLNKDIVTLGFIKNLTIEDGDVNFVLELTTPACPVKEQFVTDCKTAVGALEGVNHCSTTCALYAARRPPRGAVGYRHIRTLCADAV
jgi:ATP-binding protein involved in chromosome partitioning